MNTDFFHEHGYQIFEDILPIDLIDEIRSLLEMDALRSLAFARNEIGCNNAAMVGAPIDAITREVTSSSGTFSKTTRDVLSGHISLETRLSADLRRIPNHSNIQVIAKALLDSEKLFMHMPPTARFILPGNFHAAVPAHQDLSYNTHLSNFVVIWVPLVDIDDDCGGVLVYHGSGFEPERPVTKDAKYFWQSGVPAENFEPIHCKIKRGGVLALNKWVIHASMANKSDYTRYSIDHRFFGESDVSSKHFFDFQTNQIIAPQSELI